MLEGFSVHDKKASLYGRPFFEKNSLVAMRNLQSVVQDPKSTLSQYPEDYALYYVCLFNEDDGTMEQATPHKVVEIIDLIKKGPENGKTNG